MDIYKINKEKKSKILSLVKIRSNQFKANVSVQV